MGNSKNNKGLFLIIIVASIIVAIGLNIVINYKQIFVNDKSVSKEAIKQQIDKDASEFFEKNEEELPNIVMPGWKQITIEANTKDISGVNFYNPDANKGYYYLKFQLKIDNEILYESGLVESGKHIQNIKISRPLDPGIYDATVFIQPYKMDMKTPTNNGEVKLKLIVK